MPDQPIVYIDRLPITAHDASGVSVFVSSGSLVRPERWARAMWRKHLETEIRKLNEWELAERAQRGHIVPFERKACNGD